MSAYAALVSLQQNLGNILDNGGFHNKVKAELHSLHEKVIFFLDFLDNSSTLQPQLQLQTSSSIESSLRESVYGAEDLIESHISGILVSDGRRLRVLMIMTLVSCFYSLFLLRYAIHDAGFPVVIPRWIRIFVVGNFLPALAAIAISIILAFVLNSALQISIFSESSGYRAQEAQDLRVVLYDLNFLMKEVIRIKEASGGGGDDDHQEISAYAALLSLRKVLDSILKSGGGLRLYHNRAQLESLRAQLTFLLDFLGNASAYMASEEPELQILEATIRDEVYKAQQLIEFQIPAQFLLDSDRKSFLRSTKFLLLASLSSLSALAILTTTLVLTRVSRIVVVTLGFGTLELGRRFARAEVSTSTENSEMKENHELCLIINNLRVIVNNLRMIKDAAYVNLLSTLPAATADASSRRDLRGTRNVVVGLERDTKEIKARLTRDSSKLEVISIVGMGGIGKTTLATQVYNDPGIPYLFDVRAWVTVSQEYSLRHVLLRLLDSAKILPEEKCEDNDDELALYLHQYLMFRRYFLVIDDVWDTEIWDFLSRFFPDNCNGSRILLTSRLTDVASYPDSGSPLHLMQCLDENESWHLLHEKVFGVEACPSQLDSTGREIARSCRGLPLAILVIGGLLYKDKRRETWKEVAENLNLKLRQTEEQCLEILGLSYNHLPHYLRPCFLYMGVFLGDSEIPVSRLFSLWVAEGFIRPCTFKSSEEVAEDYLKDLIDRNLILVHKRSCSGKIRTCSTHDLLRYVCIQNALKENFFLIVEDGERPAAHTPRRLSIRSDALYANFRRNSAIYNLCVRSLLCTASKLLHNQSGLHLGFPYLRVLDVLVVHFGEFPYQIIKLHQLRYIAFHYDGPLPPSMSRLHKLQTIVHHHNCAVNKYPLLGVIWSMPNLRHLYVKPGCYLSDPLGYRLSWKSSVLEHLQTLMGIRNFKWTKGIIERIPNVKKLGISYDVSSSVDWSKYQLESLVDLHQLESLKIIIKYSDVGPAIPHDPPKLAFPPALKKLSLSGCGIPWARIGALPNLKALKVRCEAEACSTSSWETVDGGFPQLVFLLLEQLSFARWQTDAHHFPRLQRLIIRSCVMLEEIPSAIGDIPTLEVIELDGCLASVVASAKQIKEEQESMGNGDLRICIGLSRHIPRVQ